MQKLEWETLQVKKTSRNPTTHPVQKLYLPCFSYGYLKCMFVDILTGYIGSPTYLQY